MATKKFRPPQNGYFKPLELNDYYQRLLWFIIDDSAEVQSSEERKELFARVSSIIWSKQTRGKGPPKTVHTKLLNQIDKLVKEQNVGLYAAAREVLKNATQSNRVPLPSKNTLATQYRELFGNETSAKHRKIAAPPIHGIDLQTLLSDSKNYPAAPSEQSLEDEFMEAIRDSLHWNSTQDSASEPPSENEILCEQEIPMPQGFFEYLTGFARRFK